jgi:hypothetical protein
MAGREGPEQPRHADFMGPSVDPDLDELGAEGVGDLVRHLRPPTIRIWPLFIARKASIGAPPGFHSPYSSITLTPSASKARS